MNVKRTRAVVLVALFLLAVLAALVAARATNGSGSGGSGEAAVTPGAVTPATTVRPSILNGSVRSLPQVPVSPRGMMREPEEPQTMRAIPSSPAPRQPIIADAPAPSPLQNFAGLKRNDVCNAVACGAGTPPDTNGAVGPNNYIQSVNSSFAIYSKTGTLQASFTENALFAASGTNPCNGNSFGDPVVLYDALADRWILTNLRLLPCRREHGRAVLRVHRRLEDGRPGQRRLVPLPASLGQRRSPQRRRRPVEHAQRLPEVRGLEPLRLLLVQRVPERRHLQRGRLRRAQPS